MQTIQNTKRLIRTQWMHLYCLNNLISHSIVCVIFTVYRIVMNAPPIRIVRYTLSKQFSLLFGHRFNRILPLRHVYSVQTV
jgi:hypothetical protein